MIGSLSLNKQMTYLIFYLAHVKIHFSVLITWKSAVVDSHAVTRSTIALERAIWMLDRLIWTSTSSQLQLFVVTGFLWLFWSASIGYWPYAASTQLQIYGMMRWLGPQFDMRNTDSTIELAFNWWYGVQSDASLPSVRDLTVEWGDVICF